MRRFDGWEPAELHELVYDDAGRHVRTIVTREPEWDDDERAWMLGLAQREAAQCRRCGGDLVETTNYANKYVPLDPLICLCCLGLHQSEEAHRKHPHAAGMIHRVQRTIRPQPSQRRR